MPAFSIIIPSHNRAILLREAIESVLAQTFTDYELIVVDDGSTDESQAMLNNFRDARLNVITQSQRGPSAARNAGAHRATGRWLAFLDSDDLWLPGKLAAQADWFAAHPDMLICQTEEIWLRDGRRLRLGPRHRKADGWIFPRALDLCLVSPSAVALGRTLFLDAGGFDESFPACEDYDLWLRLLHDRPIGLIPEPFVVKRAGAWPQLSRDVPALDRWRVLAIAKLLRSSALSQENRKLALGELNKKGMIYIHGCDKRGRRDEAEEFRHLLAECGVGEISAAS